MRKTQNFLRRAGSAALALTLTVSLCQPAFAATMLLVNTIRNLGDNNLIMVFTTFNLGSGTNHDSVRPPRKIGTPQGIADNGRARATDRQAATRSKH